MGGDIFNTFEKLCLKANIKMMASGNSNTACCGQIFSSKGYTDAYSFTSNQTIEKLWVDSEQGKFQIVMDVTSCTQTLKTCRYTLSDENKARFDKMTFFDVIDFAADKLLPNLTISKQKDNRPLAVSGALSLTGC